jgi:nitrogen fixation NifU-like protein
MQYGDEVMDHFKNPRNMGEIKNADGVGEVGNLKCGDVMRVFIKIKTRKLKAKSEKLKVEEYISDIKFKTLGCAAAIAASSMMTELAKGKSLEDAEKISRDDVNDSLGKLPAQKYHCSVLSAEGIRKAIEDYRRKKSGSITTSE